MTNLSNVLKAVRVDQNLKTAWFIEESAKAVAKFKSGGGCGFRINLKPSRAACIMLGLWIILTHPTKCILLLAVFN